MTEPWEDLRAQVDASPATWSIRVTEVPTRAGVRRLGQVGDGRLRVLLDIEPSRTLPAASIGKILLLVAVVRRLEAGELDPEEVLPVHADDLVGDSGLLQYLRGALCVTDHLTLVAGVSDNLSTNTLLRRIGLAEVEATADRAGLNGVVLHDAVRDARGGEHAPHLSSASAASLCDLLVALHRGLVVSPAVSRRVVDLLRLDVDTSMVAAAFGLDPLAHRHPDRGLSVWHKTGTSDGIRADAGVAVGPRSCVAYAVLAAWDPGPGDPLRDHVLATMTRIGRAVHAVAG